MALLLTLPGSAAAQSDPMARYRYLSCIGGKCYHPDFFGGLGLEPKRKYSVAFGTHKVCGIVRDALNTAIRAGSASLRAVLRPLPLEAQTNTWPWPGHDITTYETRNPIFAADIFLPWNWIGWGPWPGAEPRPDDLQSDYSRARWMIAPVFNDGKPLLMTQTSGLGVNVWDVPEDELGKRDWSDWRSYSGFKPRLSPCALQNEYNAGPLGGLGHDCKIPRRVLPEFPRLTAQQQASAPFLGAGRAVAIAYFAFIEQHYYAALQTPGKDLILVVDPGDHAPEPSTYGVQSPDADLCYLLPSLSN